MTIDKILSLKWERPDGVEYPKVWHTFMERGLDSDQLVEYRIEDLSFEKVGEVFQHMQTNYIQDEPIEQVFGMFHFSDKRIVIHNCWNHT